MKPEISDQARQAASTLFEDGKWVTEEDVAQVVQEAIDAHNDAQWHPVSEPPNDDRYILALLEVKGVTMSRTGYFDKVMGLFWINGMATDKVTHWRELPQAPKGTK